MFSPLCENVPQTVLIIVVVILTNDHVNLFTESLVQLFPLLAVFQDIVLLLDCHYLVLLAPVLVHLDSFIRLLNCVVNRVFILPDLALCNPVLETLFQPIKLPVSKMVDPVFEHRFSVLLEFNDILPFLYASHSFDVVKPGKGISQNPVGLCFQFSVPLIVVVDVLSVIVNN